MRLEKYEPGLDEPTCQDVHMPALSIPPGQAFLVKVELSPPPATGVMGTIGQLLGGGEDDQKDPVARMFKVGRQTHPSENTGGVRASFARAAAACLRMPRRAKRAWSAHCVCISSGSAADGARRRAGPARPRNSAEDVFLCSTTQF